MSCRAIRRVEVFVADHDVASRLILVAIDDVIRADRLAGTLIDALASDRREVALVEQIEFDLVRAGRRIKRYGNVNEAERDGTFPDDSRHDVSSCFSHDIR